MKKRVGINGEGLRVTIRSGASDECILASDRFKSAVVSRGLRLTAEQTRNQNSRGNSMCGVF